MTMPSPHEFLMMALTNHQLKIAHARAVGDALRMRLRAVGVNGETVIAMFRLRHPVPRVFS